MDPVFSEVDSKVVSDPASLSMVNGGESKIPSAEYMGNITDLNECSARGIISKTIVE
jgi:hypothetical protein